jgi:hypothetical protein
MSDVQRDGGRVTTGGRGPGPAGPPGAGLRQSDPRSRGGAPGGWWLASDGKWYPPVESFAVKGSGARVGAGPETPQPAAGWWLASDHKWYGPDFPSGAASAFPAVVSGDESGRGATGGSGRGSGSWFAAMEWAARGTGPGRQPAPPETRSSGGRPAFAQPAPVAQQAGAPDAGDASAGRSADTLGSAPDQPGTVGPGRPGGDPRPAPRVAAAPAATSRRGSASEWDFISSEDLVEAPGPSRKAKLSDRLRRSHKPKADEPDGGG